MNEKKFRKEVVKIIEAANQKREQEYEYAEKMLKEGKDHSSKVIENHCFTLFSMDIAQNDYGKLKNLIKEAEEKLEEHKNHEHIYNPRLEVYSDKVISEVDPTAYTPKGIRLVGEMMRKKEYIEDIFVRNDIMKEVSDKIFKMVSINKRSKSPTCQLILYKQIIMFVDGKIDLKTLIELNYNIHETFSTQGEL